MQKIISLFQRNYDGDRLVRDEVVPGAEWVIAGEGVATRKFDGTCCMIHKGDLWKRYEVKKGGKPPEGFLAANEVDEVTGKQQGWMYVDGGPENQWHCEALLRGVDHAGAPLRDGTYELCGPKIQGNPEGFAEHVLVLHGVMMLVDDPRTFDSIRAYLETANIEGIVWHHDDGRMVKIKAKDFGIKRAVATAS